MRIRPARPEDGADILALIDEVLVEHGDRLHTPGCDADLLDLEGSYSARGGAFVVLDDDGRVRGTHAALPVPGRPGVCTFRRLYLHRDLRGLEWGRLLMEWAIAWAREAGARRVEFWSDVRFERAHRFFERLGFRRDGRTRTMDDGSAPYREHFFFLDL